jgi:hypothetical protein
MIIVMLAIAVVVAVRNATSDRGGSYDPSAESGHDPSAESGHDGASDT